MVAEIDSIWSEYRSKLSAFVYSRIANPADAEDLLQEILIKVYRNVESVKSDRSLESWIFQIARNSIIDYYRRKKTFSQLDLEELWNDDTDPDTKHILAQCVVPFIEALPENQRDLLRAIDLEGQSQKEYAALHGLPYSTLKSRVKKAREALRSLFEDCCHFSVDARGNIMEYNRKSKFSCDD